jgi:hypothetical protein
MWTQELVQAVMRERALEAARLEREYKARALQERNAAPRGVPSQRVSPRRRNSLISLVTRAFPQASVS